MRTISWISKVRFGGVPVFVEMNMLIQLFLRNGSAFPRGGAALGARNAVRSENEACHAFRQPPLPVSEAVRLMCGGRCGKDAVPRAVLGVIEPRGLHWNGGQGVSRGS